MGDNGQFDLLEFMKHMDHIPSYHEFAKSEINLHHENMSHLSNGTPLD